jgi:hypothetical protein
MSETKSFVVTPFKNPSGAIVYRVTGWLDGLRFRKNFQTREDAAAEKAALEIKALQATAGMRAAMTFLPDGRPGFGSIWSSGGAVAACSRPRPAPSTCCLPCP